MLAGLFASLAVFVAAPVTHQAPAPSRAPVTHWVYDTLTVAEAAPALIVGEHLLVVPRSLISFADTLPAHRILADTLPAQRILADTLPVQPTLRWVVADTDTLIRKKRRPLTEYSEWYSRRVTLHRRMSYAMLPLFAASYYTGNRLLTDGRRNSPSWVRNTHPIAAGGAAVLFGANTITGAWNLWASRRDADGRTRRILHAVLLTAADAGFAYAGSLGDEASENGKIRSRHRTIALSSMAVSTASWVYMLITK
jgi:hypothetical protein